MEAEFYCPSCGEITTKEISNRIVPGDEIIFQCKQCEIEWKIEIQFWELGETK